MSVAVMFLYILWKVNENLGSLGGLRVPVHLPGAPEPGGMTHLFRMVISSGNGSAKCFHGLCHH